MTRLTREQLESLWAEHLAGEFTTRDVEATLATMIDSASVNHVPVNTGGRGKDDDRAPTLVHAARSISGVNKSVS